MDDRYKGSAIQRLADTYPTLDNVQLAICEIARLSHTRTHGVRIYQLLESLVATVKSEAVND